MTAIDNWLVRYQLTQESVRIPSVYWLAILMVVLGFTGLLWNLPVPDEFLEISPFFNWGSAFLMVAAVYYFIISLSLAIGLLPFLLSLATLHVWFAVSEYPAATISGVLLSGGTLGLAFGRSGSLHAVVQDIQLAMIAPAWLLSLAYKRFGIPI